MINRSFYASRNIIRYYFITLKKIFETYPKTNLFILYRI